MNNKHILNETFEKHLNLLRKKLNEGDVEQRLSDVKHVPFNIVLGTDEELTDQSKKFGGFYHSIKITPYVARLDFGHDKRWRGNPDKSYFNYIVFFCDKYHGQMVSRLHDNNEILIQGKPTIQHYVESYVNDKNNPTIKKEIVNFVRNWLFAKADVTPTYLFLDPETGKIGYSESNRYESHNRMKLGEIRLHLQKDVDIFKDFLNSIVKKIEDVKQKNYQNDEGDPLHHDFLSQEKENIEKFLTHNIQPVTAEVKSDERYIKEFSKIISELINEFPEGERNKLAQFSDKLGLKSTDTKQIGPTSSGGDKKSSITENSVLNETFNKHLGYLKQIKK